jgi:hypothetical protein
MIVLRTWQSTLTQVPDAAFEDLSAAMTPSLRAILRPAVQAQAAILEVVPDVIRRPPDATSHLFPASDQQIIDCEIFTDGSSLFVIEVTRSNTESVPRLAAGFWQEQPNDMSSNEQAGESELILSLNYIGTTLDHPCLKQAKKAANTAFKASLKATRFTSRKFKALKGEGRAAPAPPSLKETDAVRALTDRSTRSLAQAIKSSGGLLVGDLSKQLPPEARNQTDEIRRSLESKELIEKELVVICKKSQSQIARVPSREALQSMSRQGLKCACGRSVSDENVEEVVSVTDLGRVLLDGSRWLTLLLLEELQCVGVPLDDTLIEQQVGGDEVDCLAVVSGEFVFFELKDKDFNLGNAYSFGAKIGILRPDHAIILTTQKVGTDARDHFERAHLARKARKGMDFELSSDQSPQLRYVEGLEHLPAVLQEFAGEIYSQDARRVLSRVLPFATIDAEALLVALEKGKSENASDADPSAKAG